MPRQPPLRHFNVILLKDGVSEPEDALRTDQEFDTLSVQGGGTLTLKPRQSNPPWWAGFLRPYVSDPSALDNLFNSSNSAVVLLQAGGRQFAITFGHGRTLLEAATFERDFGLRVVLNTVAPDQLKSVDARTFDDLTIHTRRDVSQGSSIEAFGLDISRDLVRAVTGRPSDETLARQVTGSDALALRSRAQVTELPALCERLLEAYRSDAYKERFAWIDHLRPIKDPAQIDSLNDVLLTALRERNIDDLHLAPPEPLDWARIEGFRLSPEPSNAELHADPPISSYLDSLEHPEALDLQRLKRDRVMAVGSDQGSVFENWSVYRCLVFETRMGDRLFALSAGDWFSIEKPFADEVTAFVESLPALGVALPAAQRGTTEGDYNVGAAQEVDALCMDRKLVTVGGQDPVELCDLLTQDKQFIHVKKRGASSTLSHLFQQGLVSAELLFRDQPFRDAARSRVNGLDSSFTDGVPDSRPAPQECEVAFVVITRSTRDTPLTLPFFSLVALRTAVLQLQDWGYRVSVLPVPEA